MAQDKISDVLQRREKVGRNLITLLVLGALGAIGFYYWGLIVPFVLDTVTNTLKLAVACLALVGLGFLIFDPRMRTNWTYMWRSFTRWVTAQFIDIDPIGILKTFVERLKAKLRELEEAIGSLQGQRDQLAEFIAKNEQERMHELQRASVAKKIMEKGGQNTVEMRGQLALSGRQAGRLEASNKTLGKLLARMDHLLGDLSTLRNTSSIVCQDIEQEVQVKEAEFKMITKGYGAFKKAQSIMASGGSERELYDETLNRLADNFNEKMGQIEYFMEISKSVINGAALDNMAYEESALAELEKWEKDAAGTTTKDGASSGVRVDVSANNNVRVGEVEDSSEGFGDLFKSQQGK